MQRVIWKYDLNTHGRTMLELKYGSKLRHLEYQDSTYGTGLKAWFRVDPAEMLISERHFVSIMTGEAIPKGAEYLRTVSRDDGMVFHVFEEKK